jgi:hypothetical protein
MFTSFFAFSIQNPPRKELENQENAGYELCSENNNLCEQPILITNLYFTINKTGHYDIYQLLQILFAFPSLLFF